MDIYEAIGRRRDVRREFSGEVIGDDALMRILAAGHAAPSVGLSQPWDFHVVRRPERLRAFAEHVAGCRCDFADSLPDDRRDTFNPIRIEGIVESGTGVEKPVRPVAWLCLGPVTHLAEVRDLEAFGWRKGLELDEVVHWD